MLGQKDKGNHNQVKKWIILFCFISSESRSQVRILTCTLQLACGRRKSNLLACNKFKTCHTFEKLTDTFCLRPSPSCAVTLPNTNSTITDTISVEVLEYCTVYETLEKENKGVINSKRGKKIRVLGTDFSFCLVKDVPWSSPFSFLLCRKY